MSTASIATWTVFGIVTAAALYGVWKTSQNVCTQMQKDEDQCSKWVYAVMLVALASAVGAVVWMRRGEGSFDMTDSLDTGIDM